MDSVSTSVVVYETHILTFFSVSEYCFDHLWSARVHFSIGEGLKDLSPQILTDGTTGTLSLS